MLFDLWLKKIIWLIGDPTILLVMSMLQVYIIILYRDVLHVIDTFIGYFIIDVIVGIILRF